MTKLYDDVFKERGDGEMERIEKARDRVEELARERVHNGLDDTMAEARVAVYKSHPDLTSTLWDAPPTPEVEEPEPETKRRKVEEDVLKRASVLADKTPGLSLTEAALRVLRNDADLMERYFDN